MDGLPCRTALIYDDSIRPDTTGGYCLRALQHRGPVTHISPAQLDGVSPDSFDFFLCIDDGLDYPFPHHLHPSAFWAIDTHPNFPRALSRARDFDAVFAAQKQGSARLQAEGVERCEWLPLACDPDIHRKLEVEKRWDVAFVGHVFDGPCRHLLDQVQRHFPDSFLGRAPHTQMAEIYSAARIVINSCLNNDLNMRVFEAMSCGALLITDHLQDNGQEGSFLNASLRPPARSCSVGPDACSLWLHCVASVVRGAWTVAPPEGQLWSRGCPRGRRPLSSLPPAARSPPPRPPIPGGCAG